MARTIGDSYNIRCPHCEKNNTYVCQGKRIVFERKIFLFEKLCFHCGQIVYYEAEWIIKITAEQHNPIGEDAPSG